MCSLPGYPNLIETQKKEASGLKGRPELRQVASVVCTVMILRCGPRIKSGGKTAALQSCGDSCLHGDDFVMRAAPQKRRQDRRTPKLWRQLSAW